MEVRPIHTKILQFSTLNGEDFGIKDRMEGEGGSG